MTNAQSTNWFITAATLRSAFVQKTRESNTADSELEPTYWACRDDIDIDSDLKAFIRELHDDELPNDWRYEMIVRILDEIIEISRYNDNPEWSDESSAIADRLTCIYNAELAAWFADCPARFQYHDDAEEDGLICANASLSQRLMAGQYRCIEQMIYPILSKLDLL